MHVAGQCLNVLAELFDEFCQLRVLLKQNEKLLRLLNCKGLTLFARFGEGFAVLRIGSIGMCFVTVSLSCLGKQYKALSENQSSPKTEPRCLNKKPGQNLRPVRVFGKNSRKA